LVTGSGVFFLVSSGFVLFGAVELPFTVVELAGVVPPPQPASAAQTEMTAIVMNDARIDWFSFKIEVTSIIN
jgi:hypothetical protein